MYTSSHFVILVGTLWGKLQLSFSDQGSIHRHQLAASPLSSGMTIHSRGVLRVRLTKHAILSSEEMPELRVSAS